MKRIFLIGDSIRLGYDGIVRELMQDEAQVYWSRENAQYTTHTLRFVHEWASCDCDPAKIDLVHWNNGLWDSLHLPGDALTVVPPDEYRRNLRRIAARLRTVFPHARLTFATTTSVITERMRTGFWRVNDEIEAYNDIAREVMREEGIAVDELYAVARDMPDDWHALDGTHFTEEGYRALAEAVVRFLREVSH